MDKLVRAIEMRQEIMNEMTLIQHTKATSSSIHRLCQLIEQNNQLENLVINEYGLYGLYILLKK
jgi:hypothetical protein